MIHATDNCQPYNKMYPFHTRLLDLDIEFVIMLACFSNVKKPLQNLSIYFALSIVCVGLKFILTTPSL